MKLGSLKLKPNTKIMMMGTREESLVGDKGEEKLTDPRAFITIPGGKCYLLQLLH